MDKPIYKQLSKNQILDIQRDLKEDPDHKLKLQGIFSDNELREIENYRYISPFEKLGLKITLIRDKIVGFYFSHKSLFITIGIIGLVILFIILIANNLSLDHPRESDIMERKLGIGF